MAAHWPCSYAGICTQLEFAGEQISHAILIHDQHNQVHRLSADLQSNAAALHGEECGSAPAFGSKECTQGGKGGNGGNDQSINYQGTCEVLKGWEKKCGVGNGDPKSPLPTPSPRFCGR